jgi:hypothetical protein
VTRERDHYPRASLGEQIREGLLGFWRNRAARLIAAALLGGFLILRLLTPQIVPFAELRTGDCVYLRPPGPAELTTSVQPVPDTTADLLSYEVAERADCNLSHSHEVTDAFSLGAAATSYPGVDALVASGGSRCAAAFEPFVGRGHDNSAYTTALAVPAIAAWEAGARYGVCFVFNRDQTLLDHHVRGSGG